MRMGPFIGYLTLVSLLCLVYLGGSLLLRQLTIHRKGSDKRVADI